MKKVIKRDGRTELFDKEKIVRAVELSFQDIENEISEKAHLKAREIANFIANIEDDLTVEQIQDIVEEKLMASNYKNIARNFITYRYERTKMRERNSQFMKDISEKLAASNVQNQNANVDEYSFGGRMGEAKNSLMKKFALDYILSDMARENHLNNEIYIHDLDAYAVGMHNCLTIPFDKLLENGFNTRQTDVRPARSINTAFQLVAVLFQLQSLQQFGGVSASHLDWTIVPYVRISFRKHFNEGMEFIEESDLRCEADLSIEDDFYKQFPRVYKYAMAKTEKELMQAVQGMYHNLNTLQSRSGNQLPFTSINYGTCTLPEGRMVIKALLEGSIEGVGKVRKTPIFPCGIFQCMKGVNRKPGDPNYDLFQLALKSTSKRLYPNYVNVDWSTNVGYDKNDPKTYVSTMGKCKLQLI
ncbi:MAG: hypothetical protein IJH63_11250 [Methanobrevibacter sp.]|nr:hypothetical protein [Methanobrevibacter sp.]